MFSQRTQLFLFLLTSSALPLLLALGLAIHARVQTLSRQIQKEDFITVLSREFLNWRTLVATLIALSLPTYFITFHSTSIIDRVKNSMNHYLTNGGPANRSIMRSRKKFHDLDEETLKKVMKRGGNIGGLVNDGNTCFMNSVLQSLASSNTLLHLLEDEKTQDLIETKDLRFMKSLRTLIQRLNTKHFNGGRDYKTTPMLKTMSKTPNKNFLLGYNQEDAQEFFQTILSELESDLKKSTKEITDAESSTPEPSTPSSASSSKNGPLDRSDIPQDAVFGNDRLGHLGDVYVPASQIDPNLENAEDKVYRYNLLTPVDGLSAERIGCLRCGEMGGIRYSVISGLSLNLPADNYAALKLTELLNKWVEPEIIEGVDCNRCALKHVLEYQEEQLVEIQGNPHPTSKILVEKLSERIAEIKHELKKPIIDDEVFKKLHTKNMMQKTSKSKQILISRPPPLLAMHINRSVFDPETFRVRKNGARVVFPLKLDLDQYVAEPDQINTDARYPLSKKETAPSSFSDEEIEDAPETEPESETPSLDSEDAPDSLETPHTDPEHITEPAIVEKSLGLDSDSESSSDEELVVRHQTRIPLSVEKRDISGPLVYQLRSVIVHYGSHNYGHYIAYRKYRGVWWRTSDENIEIVDEDEVLSAPGTFMLFYELDSLCQELAKDEKEIEDEGEMTTTVVVSSAEESSTEQPSEKKDQTTILRKEDKELIESEEEEKKEEAAEQQANSIANL